MHPLKIYTLWQLDMAVKSKKAVFVPEGFVWSKPKPAAVMINLPGAVLLRLFDKGMYIYNKPHKGESK